jgi:hypothetical protein
LDAIELITATAMTTTIALAIQRPGWRTGTALISSAGAAGGSGAFTGAVATA